ncbi:MAG: hypothetical protein AAFX50_14735, partial [Acidobacteriota bacterium]
QELEQLQALGGRPRLERDAAGGADLVLPPELEEGVEVLLSFKLDPSIEFSRLPAVIRHQISATGGVSFQPWPSAERLKLLEFLVTWYEQEQQAAAE